MQKTVIDVVTFIPSMKRSALVKALLFTPVAISLAQDNERELHRGGGGGRGKGGGGRHKDRVEMALKGNCYWGKDDGEPLITRIIEECENVDCPEGEGDTTYTCLEWEYSEDEVIVEGCDEDMTPDEAEALRQEYKTDLEALREKIKNMTEEERDIYRDQMNDLRQRNAENARKCGCCTSGPEFELGELTSEIEGTVARALGFGCPKGQGGQGSHHGHKGQLQDKVDQQCTDEYKSATCPATLTVDTDCALEKPKRPDIDWWSLSSEEREDLKEKMQALKDEFFAQVLKCACCAELTVAELLGYTSDGASASASVEELLGLDSKNGMQQIFPRPGGRPYKHKPHRRRQRGH